MFKSSGPWQNENYFAPFFDWNWCILIKISRIFVAKGAIVDQPVFVQMMARYQTGAFPLSEQIMSMFAAVYIQQSSTPVAPFTNMV